jgi:hypothetical protein
MWLLVVGVLFAGCGSSGTSSKAVRSHRASAVNSRPQSRPTIESDLAICRRAIGAHPVPAEAKRTLNTICEKGITGSVPEDRRAILIVCKEEAYLLALTKKSAIEKAFSTCEAAAGEHITSLGVTLPH